MVYQSFNNPRWYFDGSLLESECANKIMSDSQGLVHFVIGLVSSVFNLPDGQVMFFERFKEQKNCEINSARQKAFGAS